MKTLEAKKLLTKTYKPLGLPRGTIHAGPLPGKWRPVKLFGDADRDGVANIFDCQPHNARKQDVAAQDDDDFQLKELQASRNLTKITQSPRYDRIKKVNFKVANKKWESEY